MGMMIAGVPAVRMGDVLVHTDVMRVVRWISAG